jgi:integrase
MGVRMATLWRDRKTGKWRSRKVIPVDIRQAFGKREDNPRWPARYTEAEAKEAFSAWLAEIEAKIKAVSGGIVRLEPHHIEALAVRWYQKTVARLVSGKEPLEAHKTYLEWITTTPDSPALLAYYRAEAVTLLQSEGLALRDGDRDALAAKLQNSDLDAHRTVINRLKGDTTPDPILANAVPWVHPVRANDATKSLPLSKLWEAYEAKRTGKIAASTMLDYRRTFASFQGYLKDKRVSDVTEDDVYAWAAWRQTEEGGKVRADVVQKNDVAAMSAVFGWAMKPIGGRLISNNPASNVDLDARRPAPSREALFTQDEITRILTATLDPFQGRNPHPTRVFARRWVPWLCAYSGARVTEMTQLRKQDIYDDGGVWVMRITPDAGSVKDREPRRVPIHAHVIDQGFLEAVGTCPEGPLFYDPLQRRNTKATHSQASLESQKLAAWIRKMGKLPASGVSPNHGWRHTWRSTAAGLGFSDALLDAITGQTAPRASKRYEHLSGFLAEHMARYPRYGVDATGAPTAAPANTPRRR